MDGLLQDLRYALRKLFRERALTLAVLTCLSLGIGANTAMFSVFNAILLKPLPFTEPDRLVTFFDMAQREGQEPQRFRVAPPNFAAWREDHPGLTGLGVAQRNYAVLSGDVAPQRVRSADISADLLPTLGVEPMLGRGFLPEEDTAGAPSRVVLLGYELWRRELGGDPDILGRRIQVDAEDHEVIGVMPRGFRFPEGRENPDGTDLWKPFGLDPFQGPQRRWHYLNVVGRLAPETSLETAQEQMNGVMIRLAESEPDLYQGWGVLLVDLREDLVGDLRPALRLLMLAVGLLLLIACVNVANLMIARYLARHQEFAVRRALGGGQGRLVRQLLTEACLLSLLGGVLGLVLARLCLPFITALVPSELSVSRDISIDLPVLGFTFGVALVTGLLFGLLPALKASRRSPSSELVAASNRVAGARSSQRFQNALVITEVTLAMVLLVTAGLLLKSFHRLQGVDAGVRLERGLALSTVFSPQRYPEGHQRLAFLDEARAEIARLPGVDAVAITSGLPLGQSPLQVRISLADRPVDDPEVLATYHRLISPGYLEVMGIPLVAGRPFAVTDTADSQPVAIVSEEMARRYWPGENPLGKRVKRGAGSSENPWVTVVGVAKDVRDVGLGDGFEPAWYRPYTQEDFTVYHWVVRTHGEPLAMLPAVREAIWTVDDEQALYDLRSLEMLTADSLADPRFNMVLLTLFSALALALVLAGLYGVVSYFVRQRRSEIGVRMALGAQGGAVLGMVVRRGLALILAGIAAGVLAATLGGRFLSRFLFSVSPADGLTLALAGGGLLAAAILVVLLPALRATRTDPAVVLRAE